MHVYICNVYYVKNINSIKFLKTINFNLIYIKGHYDDMFAKRLLGVVVDKSTFLKSTEVLVKGSGNDNSVKTG